MRAVALTFLVFIYFISPGVAQIQAHVGATSAYNATFVLDGGLADDQRYEATATYNWAPFGINIGVDFGRTFCLSVEGIKSMQGQVYELVNVTGDASGERRIELDYIHMPLLAKFISRTTGAARANFSIGPQLSLLTDAREYLHAQAGEFKIPDKVEFESIQSEFPNATQTTSQAKEGTYSLPDTPAKDILTKKGNDFRETELQVAVALGVDIDLARHLFLSAQLRANYSLTDMRNGDVIDAVKNGDRSDIFGHRANLLAGFQLGLHYMFGSTRSFKYKR